MPSINKQYAQTRYNVSRSQNRTISYIVIHYTGTSASAENNCVYFSGGDRQASADFFVDKNGSIYQFNADLNNYYSWHCGDGHGRYGITNQNSIGIENVSAGEDFTSQQISSLTSLVKILMSQYNIPADHVVRHYDASRKLCPAPYIDSNKWKTLWQQITSGEGDPLTTGGTTVSGSASGTLTISYDRTKDPLLEEFGYAKIVSKESDANLGKWMKAQKEEATYPVSAINTADLLNDIFDIWGFSISGGNSGASEGEQVPGRAVTQSGKVITSGIRKPVPSGVAQTGIIANYTAYDRSWASGTTQRTIYELWNQQGKPSSHSVCTVNGYYLLAPGRYFSNTAGDILEWELANGTKFMSIVADTKGSDTASEYGHLFGGAADIIEWESAVSQSQLTSGLREWGIYGVDVVAAVNYGTFFQ